MAKYLVGGAVFKEAVKHGSDFKRVEVLEATSERSASLKVDSATKEDMLDHIKKHKPKWGYIYEKDFTSIMAVELEFIGWVRFAFITKKSMDDLKRDVANMKAKKKMLKDIPDPKTPPRTMKDRKDTI